MEQAEALLLVTEWPEFAGLDLVDLASRMKSKVLVDGRNLFDPEAARAAGFKQVIQTGENVADLRSYLKTSSFGAALLFSSN